MSTPKLSEVQRNVLACLERNGYLVSKWEGLELREPNGLQAPYPGRLTEATLKALLDRGWIVCAKREWPGMFSVRTYRITDAGREAYAAGSNR